MANNQTKNISTTTTKINIKKKGLVKTKCKDKKMVPATSLIHENKFIEKD